MMTDFYEEFYRPSEKLFLKKPRFFPPLYASVLMWLGNGA